MNKARRVGKELFTVWLYLLFDIWYFVFSFSVSLLVNRLALLCYNKPGSHTLSFKAWMRNW
jgi:hypothetical protein